MNSRYQNASREILLVYKMRTTVIHCPKLEVLLYKFRFESRIGNFSVPVKHFYLHSPRLIAIDFRTKPTPSRRDAQSHVDGEPAAAPSSTAARTTGIWRKTHLPYTDNIVTNTCFFLHSHDTLMRVFLPFIFTPGIPVYRSSILQQFEQPIYETQNRLETW